MVTSQIYEKYVEIGRVVYIASGKDAGKLAVIVNVVDGNKAMLDGPSTGVARCVRNFKELQLTKFKVTLRVGMRTKSVKAAFDEAGVAEKWKETSWAKNIQKRLKRASLNDFERFKVMRAKKLRNRLVATELGKLRKTSKTAGKPTKSAKTVKSAKPVKSAAK